MSEIDFCFQAKCRIYSNCLKAKVDLDFIYQELLCEMRRIKKTRIVLYHLLAWISGSLLWIIFSETLTKHIAPGFDSVELWLIVNTIGIVLITGITIVSCFVILRKRNI